MKFIRASLPTTIEMEDDLKASDTFVMADPTQIHQIFMNLYTNAGHAMKGKGCMSVCLDEITIANESMLQYKELKQGNYVRLTVSDTGHGISKELIDRIFDPFFTTKERGEGTGMGLSVVHGIVKDMGGAISVQSEPDKGTTFYVYLPKYEGEVADLSCPQYIPKKGNARILFVDDEKSIVVVISKMLERMGYEVVTTTSGLEALELFESSPETFDLVITDMSMPKITGIELSSRLNEIRPDIPVVLITGFSAGITKETIKKANIREMVMKPIISGVLAEAIEKALKPDSKQET